MKNKDIYLSGKISGLDFDEAFKLFEEAEQEVRLLGLNPINPMKLNHNHGKTWIEYMEVDLRALKSCFGIYMLRNYKESNGARIELMFAQEAKKFPLYQEINKKLPYLYPISILTVNVIQGYIKDKKNRNS